MILLPNVDYGQDKIWYAAYGSNLSEERFLCYVEGGRPEGASEGQSGMSDKTRPLLDTSLTINHRLYFARSSGGWGGGVAFIDPNDSDKPETCCRIYLIKKKQFAELYAQENRMPVKDVEIKEADLERRKSWEGCSGHYGLIMKVDEHAGRPVYTFTKKTMDPSELSAPGEPYLKTIIRGLVESWSSMKDEGIINYVHKITKGAFEKNQIEAWLHECEEEYVSEFLERKDADDGVPLRVQRTERRDENRREFIAQLSKRLQGLLKVREGDTLTLSSEHNGQWFSVMARVNNAKLPCKDHVINLDQKLRVAIGVRIGDWVNVRKARRSEMPRMAKILEGQIGTQAELMRVQMATFEDMEIPIARVPESTFEAIGTEPGRFLSVQSMSKIARLRATTLSEGAWEHRTEEMESEKERYCNPRKALGLDRLEGGSVGNDLSPIFLDLDMRKRLDVDPCDCVRVVRDVKDSYLSRIHRAALPIMFAAIGFAMSLEVSDIVKVGIIAAGIVLSMYTLYLDVRSKIR